MDQAKNLLRKEIKKKLSSLTDEMKSKQSVKVFQKLISMKEWRESRRVATFLSMSDEISTIEMLKRGLEENKSMFIPRYSHLGMDMLKIRSMEDYHSLPETKWKIKQPSFDDDTRESPSLENGGLDVVIVPGLSFTRAGHRLGRGKGYYDGYLHRYESLFGKLPITIGVCFKEQISSVVPCTERDVLIDKVVFDDTDEDVDSLG